MRTFSGIFFLLVAVLPYIAMLVTGSTSADLGGGDERLLILSPHRREVRLEYSRGFRDWMEERHGRSVEIQWLDSGGTSKMLKELESRFATTPDRPGVDLMFGGGIDPYLQAVEYDWLTRVELADRVLDPIPAYCAGAPVYDADARWFGVALSGFGVLHNRVLTERLDLPPPLTWDDLGRPELYSWVGSGDPRSSGSVHMCYEIILQAYGFDRGWDLITRICANVRRFGEGGGTVPREVAAGDVAAGMVIDQYAQTVIDAVGGGALVFSLPEKATLIGADSIAMIRNANSPELAVRFIEYALSEGGQRLLFQPEGVNGQRHSLHRMPVMKALYDDPDAPRVKPHTYEGGFRYDMAKGGRRWRVVNDLIGVWLIDAHADLSETWLAVIEAGLPADARRELCACPVSEDELARLVERWGDARFRLDTVSMWSSEARSRYRRIKGAVDVGAMPIAREVSE